MKRKQQELVASVTEDEFKEFVGIDAYRFIEARRRIILGDARPILNWTAILFGPVWAGFYKFWKGVINYLICMLGVALLTNAMGYPVSSLFYSLVFCITWLTLGAYLPSRYVVGVASKVSRLKKSEDNLERRRSLYERDGGVSQLSAFGALTLYVTCTAIIGNIIFSPIEEQTLSSSESAIVSAMPDKRIQSDHEKVIQLQLGANGSTDESDPRSPEEKVLALRQCQELIAKDEGAAFKFFEDKARVEGYVDPVAIDEFCKTNGFITYNCEFNSQECLSGKAVPIPQQFRTRK